MSNILKPSVLYKEKINNPRLFDVEEKIKKNANSIKDLSKINSHVNNIFESANEEILKSHNSTVKHIDDKFCSFHSEISEIKQILKDVMTNLNIINNILLTQPQIFEEVKNISLKLDGFTIEEAPVEGENEIDEIKEDSVEENTKISIDDCYEEAYNEEFEDE